MTAVWFVMHCGWSAGLSDLGTPPDHYHSPVGLCWYGNAPSELGLGEGVRYTVRFDDETFSRFITICACGYQECRWSAILRCKMLSLRGKNNPNRYRYRDPHRNRFPTPKPIISDGKPYESMERGKWELRVARSRASLLPEKNASERDNMHRLPIIAHRLQPLKR